MKKVIRLKKVLKQAVDSLQQQKDKSKKKGTHEQQSVFTKLQLVFILCLGIALGIRQMAMTMVMPFISVYSETLVSYTPMLAGIALGMFGLTQAIFQIPFGILSDKYGKKKMMLIGLCQVCIGLIIAYFAKNIYILILARAIQGSGAIIAVAYAWIALEVEEEKRMKAMGILSMIIGAAAALSFAIGPMIHQFVAVNEMFLYCTIIILFSIFCISFLLKENKSPEMIKKESSNNLVSSKEAIQLLIKNKDFVSLNVLAFFNNFIMTAVFYIVPKYLVEITTINGMWKVFLPAVVVAIVLMKLFISKENEKREATMLVISFLCCTIGVGCLFQSEFVSILVGTTFFMTGYIFITTIIPSKANRLTEDSYRGTSNGILNSFQYIGSFAGSLITGALWGMNQFVAVGAICLFCIASTGYAKRYIDRK